MQRRTWTRLVTAMLGATCLFVVAGVMRGQQALKTTKVAENLYVIEGAGGNTAFLVAEPGVLVVDTKVPNNGEKILAEIRKVTEKPVLYLVNTHLHGDHLGSNDSFPLPTTLIAQDNVRKRLDEREEQRSGIKPRLTFARKSSIFLGKERVDLHYFGRGHTDGDIVVVFRNQKIAHAGDLFVPESNPFIDQNSGGSAKEFLGTLQGIAALKGVDRLIPGHGAVTATPKQLARTIGFHQTMHAVVKDALKAGKSAAGLDQDPRFQQYADFAPGFGSRKFLPINLTLLHKELKAAQ